MEAEVARERGVERQRLGVQLQRRDAALGLARLQAGLAPAHLRVRGIGGPQRLQTRGGLLGLVLRQQVVDVAQLLLRGSGRPVLGDRRVGPGGGRGGHGRDDGGRRD